VIIKRIKKVINNTRFYKKISKTSFYSRYRGLLPTVPPSICDDRDLMGNDVEAVKLEWPSGLNKPRVGVVQDTTDCPRWTKYCRFLDTNAIPYSFYDIDSANWLEKAQSFDVIAIAVGSCQQYYLEQLRRKCYILEYHLKKKCYPSYADILLYEDKILEAYLAQQYGLPFIKTYIYNKMDEAIKAAAQFKYPIISKIVPGACSVGIEMVDCEKKCLSVIKKAFSRAGRSTQDFYLRQKNYVYFQDYVPNNGYDIRVVVVGDMVFGYYRKVLKGDFRASGMGEVEKRELPPKAMQIARKVNDILKNPMIVVDFLYGSDNEYYIIEISPIFGASTPEQLHVNGKPGVYIFSKDGSFHFKEGRYWTYELALKEFFQNSIISVNKTK